MNDFRIIRPNAGFIFPLRRFVDVGMPKSVAYAAGKYQLIVRDAYGVEKRRTPWFDNIILDSGLNRWGTGVIIAGAAIGTGTSAPAASDVGLQTQTHYTTTTGTGAGLAAGSAPNYNNTRTIVYRTALGALDGNYSEVGVGWASGSMFSRALILDGGGSPTTISVSSSEQLDIVYQLSVYPPLVDTGPSAVTISGVSYTITGRASIVSAISGVGSWGVQLSNPAMRLWGGSFIGYNGAIGAITGSPGGTPTSGDGSSTNAYSNNSLTLTGMLTASLTAGNVAGGLSSVVCSWDSQCSFQYGVSPAIPKDGTKTLSLNYSYSWARRP
jgi:hypothetical protein